MVASAPNADGSVKVTCKLTNTGKRDGAQVIQAYVGRDKKWYSRSAGKKN